MRFIEDGPDIPDALLHELDEGRVVFFCGAGVSQASADLPGFFGLAKKVLKELRVLPKEPAYQIFDLAKPDEKQKNMPTTISADLIFGELEKDFYPQDIQAAVAKKLITRRNLKTPEHSDLMKLATTQDGRIRLVTTNFDRLFENCAPKGLQKWQYPNLPDLTKGAEFEGLVYLHGRVNDDYSGCDEEFILSTAEFGRAYLAEGSATRFFKQIISEYTVVFVGYGADDPPVRYLLEALNKEKSKQENKKKGKPKNKNNIYAFQSGTQEEADKKWANRGVNVISYDDADDHKALWDTFAEWVKRVKNLKAWQDSIIRMARKGPEKLLPFQREQVAHLVSTPKGAQRFFQSDNPPPATWLCVFDRLRRCAEPMKIPQEDGTEIMVDPLDYYGLASDPTREEIERNTNPIMQSMDIKVWDAFWPNEQDENEGQNYSLASMNGVHALSVKNLPNRLHALGGWLAKVSDQNAAIWWAVRQQGIHQRVQGKIGLSLRDKTNCNPDIVKAWHYLFDSWNLKPSDMETRGHSRAHDWLSFESDIKKFDWNILMVNRYEEMAKPRMTVRPSIWRDAIPPKKSAKINLGDLIVFNILYKKDYRRIKILDKCLTAVVPALKRNLDIAIRLEKERGFYLDIAIPPIITSDDPDIRGDSRGYGFSGPFLYYASLFKKLLELNPQLAQAEAATWDKNDDNAYARLHIWSARFAEIVKDDDLGGVFSLISRQAFWYSPHQRDLLHTLKVRWAGMPDATKHYIEKRILQGYEKLKWEKRSEYTKRRDGRILQRLDWLKSKECFLSSVTEKEVARLKKVNPEYHDKYAKDADKSHEGRGGMVRTDTEHSALLELSLSEILPKSEERMDRSDNFLIEHNPFLGLCKERPVRAFAALRYEAKKGKYRPWAWRDFLYEQKRKDDSARMKRFIARVLVRLPSKTAANVSVMQALANWVKDTSEHLTPPCVPVFETLTKRLIKLLHEYHAQEDYATKSSNTNCNLGTDALNRPAGYLAQALFNDPRKNGLKAGQTFPRAWLDIVESMLALPDDQGRYALIFFTHNLNWFYDVDPQWTQDNLLQPLFDGNPDTVEAWWNGYLWGARRLLSLELFKKIKLYLLARALDKDYHQKNHSDVVVQLILWNWGHSDDGEERISNEEFRFILLQANENFRVRTLGEINSLCKNNNPPHWKDKRLALLEEVWPLHKWVKTAQASEQLINLAFDDEKAFPRLAKAIIPLLGEIKYGDVLSLFYGEDKERIIDKHPEPVLAILCKILTENANDWPYDVDKTVDRLAASPKLKRDPRLIELQRRWSAR